ncbi:MAG TPA: ParB/RepB/Spo0J family partition protein [Anaerolineaceae bacterium]|nr:ParB/RepB/Spo0J family partition protein [Anaerolineaceae bacterium]
MVKKSGLGKGLEALIPGNWDKPAVDSQKLSEQVSLIPVGKIKPNPHQPRSNFDITALEDLSASILEHGIISPLIVVLGLDEGVYTLIAGERRLRAAKLAGLTEVPAIIRSSTEQEQLELAIIENVQREDLDPLERAQAYQALLEEFSLTHEEIAKRVGKNRVTVTNSLRLLNLPEDIQNGISQKRLTEGHARALLGLANPKAMEHAYEIIQKLGLNVRQTEQLVTKLNGTPATQKPKPAPNALDKDLENRLRRHFNTKVNLQKGPKGGNLTIYFFSDEELNNILDLLDFHA